MKMLQDLDVFSPNVDLSKLPVLGRGVWGFVLDLKDGTVLKLAKPKCAGIGDGAQKILREATVLRAIHAVEPKSVVNIPKFIACGERKCTASSFSDCPLWLRTTKVIGTVTQTANLVDLSTHEACKIATSISRSIIEIHNRLERAKLNSLVPGIQQNQENLFKDLGHHNAASAYFHEMGRILKMLSHDAIKVIHGDFNISNILFEHNSVVSVVDFAETRVGFAEEDLASIISEVPNIGTFVCEEFERRSGASVNSKKLNFALASNDFFNYLISERLGQHEDSEAARKRLEKYLGETT